MRQSEHILFFMTSGPSRVTADILFCEMCGMPGQCSLPPKANSGLYICPDCVCKVLTKDEA